MCGGWGVYLVGAELEGCVVLNVDGRGYCIVMVETKIFVELRFK